MEGRVVGPCWDKLKPKGPKGKEAWPFYRTSSGVRLWWELEEPKGPKGTQAAASSLDRAGVGTGGPDVIRKEAWPFYRTSSGVRLWWELEEPKGPQDFRTTGGTKTRGA